MFDEALIALAQKLVEQLRARNQQITTAESCTGGLVAALITEISGSSSVFSRGVVSYANEVKSALLGVDKKLLAAHGAVSAEVATAMAQGALKKAHADIAIAITGIAGPTGGSPEKPVGLVFIALAGKNGLEVKRFLFKGERHEVRMQAVKAAIEMALQF